MTAVLGLTTENWDDDFEFHASNAATTRTSMALTEDWDRSPVHESRPDTTASNDRKTSISTENWDDDFEDKPESPSRRDNWDIDFELKHSSDEEHATDDDDDIDLGFAEREEDRTVTARSRRAALSRLNASPPPPVPPIPFSLLSAASDHPFPRSPTASVFSVPTLNSGRDSYYHNNSTTHLRPTISRTSMAGFANLPPSPPIHKERERRRLRKKSRPPEAVYELTVRNPLPPPSVNSSSDVLDQQLTRNRTRTASPQTPPSTPPPDPANNSNRNSMNASIGAPSPPNRTPLLSRIGSVKKWGVRKKRASSAPSEVALQEPGQDYNEQTPRPPSSHEGAPSSSPSKSGWFFRATSGGDYSGSSSHRVANKPNSRELSSQGTEAETPSKLVKRKSFGFVPIRRNKGPLNDGASSSQSDLPADLEAELTLASESNRKSRPLSQQPTAAKSRHPYAGLGLGRAGEKRVPGSTDDLTEGRDRNHSRSRSRGPQDDEQDTGKGFMENVRKISFVGRHRRTKSGASLASVGEALRVNPVDQDVHKGVEPTSIKRASVPPPIELHPPSPARVASNSTIRTPNEQSDTLLSPITGSTNTPGSTRKSPSPTSKVAASPQSASLGRSAVAPAVIANSPSNAVPRRNSLGDLKIPARISQAQVGLRRDLGMVRDFAANVEQLKDLQVIYHSVVMEVQGILDAYAHSHVQQSANRPGSPTLFSLTIPKQARSRSNTSPSTSTSQPQQAYKQLASAFYTINSKYRIAWECAELLIELGGGSTETTPASAPSTSVSAPAMATSSGTEGKRGRAITLSGDESKPANPAVTAPSPAPTPSSAASPPNPAWRASTGRHDLNNRQLLLLREMLNNPDSSFVVEDPNCPIPEEATQSTISVNRDWRWGDAMNSTVTLPSEESSVQGGSASSTKKRRSSRLGMSGIRDMLRSLKRNQGAAPLIPVSTTSISTESSLDSQNKHPHPHPHPQVSTYGRRRAKTSSGPESMKSTRERPTSPYNASSLSAAKASPRRPSLASIFRIGQKSKVTPPSSTLSSSGDSSAVNVAEGNGGRSSRQESSGTGEDEDWDRLDSAGDFDIAPSRDGYATLRGRSPYIHEKSLPSSSSIGPVTPKRSASASQTSLWADPSGPRPTRLSNVEENVDDHLRSEPSSKRAVAPSPSRQSSKVGRPMVKSGSVRSMPPQPLQDVKLAMTPENIKPLLENSKEVHARLTECIAEIRSLLVEHA